jgi:integrase
MRQMPKKGENIYKRKDQRWEARYVKGCGPNGSTRFGYCYGRTYREAKEKVQRMRAELMAGAPPAGGKKLRFSICCDEWLRFVRNGVKESTLVKYDSIVTKYISSRLGGRYVQDLNSSLVEEFGNELLNRDGLSPKTVRDILTVLSSILDHTRRQLPGDLPPIDIIYPKERGREMRVLTEKEQSDFIRYLLRDMDYSKFGVLLALLTGMRIGELCALRWGDISLNERTIKVSSTMQRLKNLNGPQDKKTKVVISDPKSRDSMRLIPLTDQAASLCLKMGKHEPSAYVLTGQSDRYSEPRIMQYRLSQYTKACGLKGVHFHVLRHTFATRAVESGFEIKSLSEVLGHSSPRITLERYVHSSMELKRANMEKLAFSGL